MIIYLIAYLSLVLVSFVPLTNAYEGEATYYATSSNGGACGYGAVQTQYFAAINSPQWEGSRNCAQCARVTGPSGSVDVRVVDLCPECKYGDLDLSQQAFEKIAQVIQGRVKITWEAIACPDNLLDGPAQYRIKEGSSIYWVAIQLRNAPVPTKAIYLDGKQGNRLDYNYFVFPSGTGGSRSIAVKAELADGTSYEDTVQLQEASSIPATQKGPGSTTSQAENPPVQSMPGFQPSQNTQCTNRERQVSFAQLKVVITKQESNYFCAQFQFQNRQDIQLQGLKVVLTYKEKPLYTINEYQQFSKLKSGKKRVKAFLETRNTPILPNQVRSIGSFCATSLNPCGNMLDDLIEAKIKPQPVSP